MLLLFLLFLLLFLDLVFGCYWGFFGCSSSFFWLLLSLLAGLLLGMFWGWSWGCCCWDWGCYLGCCCCFFCCCKCISFMGKDVSHQEVHKEVKGKQIQQLTKLCNLDKENSGAANLISEQYCVLAEYYRINAVSSNENWATNEIPKMQIDIKSYSSWEPLP